MEFLISDFNVYVYTYMFIYIYMYIYIYINICIGGLDLLDERLLEIEPFDGILNFRSALPGTGIFVYIFVYVHICIYICGSEFYMNR
jgi:hypothetical protein